MIREHWEQGPLKYKNEIQYVLDLRAKLCTLSQITQEHLLQLQESQSRLYSRGTWLQEFMQGDDVFVLLVMSSSKLLAKWQGPFVVTWRDGDVDYEVKQTNRGGVHQTFTTLTSSNPRVRWRP